VDIGFLWHDFFMPTAPLHAYQIFHIASKDCITDYDRANFVTYARILDAVCVNLPWRRAAAEILGLDIADDEANAFRIWAAYVDRAEWIVGDGLRLVSANKSLSDQLIH
jgi:hypothetical protein